MGSRATSLLAPLIGHPIDLPPTLLERWPQLRGARWRTGGLPPRIGGWALLRPTAAAMTLWRTVFVAPGVALDPELLLHEIRHVQQFRERRLFVLRYLLESIRRGYWANRFERDAREYAATAMIAASWSPLPAES
ncbi:MAG: hypothetical protein NVS9B3_12220 [Gemmatimonadaceae bacterium]